MTDKEVRKLSRAELLEMLIDQSTELEACKKKLAAAEAALADQKIAIDKAGSIAEASLLLNGVFEAAQAACQQYTLNVRERSERQEALCGDQETESRARAEEILAEAERKCAAMERETTLKCDEMLRKAKADSQKYWDDVSKKAETLYKSLAALRAQLSLMKSGSRKQ